MKKDTSFLATTVGSLPHTDYKRAVEQVFSILTEVPVLPQLANINQKEDMTSQLNERIPGIVFDVEDNRWYIDQETEEFCEQLEEFFMDYESIVNEGDQEVLEKYAISQEHCSSLPMFLEKLRETKPAFVKGQVIGPFTFGTALTDNEKKCVFYDETLREIIVKVLTVKALWILKKFREASPDSQPIIFMDEPTISQYGTSAFITVKKEDIVACFAEIASVLRKAGAIVGIHCCGKSDWGLITESNVDILNFDGFYFGESLGLYPDEIRTFLENGGKIAWGIIPTMDTDALEASTKESLIAKYEEAISYLLNKGFDKELIFKSTIITPACGCGSLNVEQAERVMHLTKELADSLKSKYLVKS